MRWGIENVYLTPGILAWAFMIDMFAPTSLKQAPKTVAPDNNLFAYQPIRQSLGSLSVASFLQLRSVDPLIRLWFVNSTALCAGADCFSFHWMRRVEIHSIRDVATGSIARLSHQATSSPKRWLS